MRTHAHAVSCSVSDADPKNKKKKKNAEEKKKNRVKAGTRALQEIRKYQKSTDLLIAKLPFRRLVRIPTTPSLHACMLLPAVAIPTLCITAVVQVREISNNMTCGPYCWTEQALLGVQEATEDFMTHLLADVQLCAIHAKRVTVLVKDMMLARRIRGPVNGVSSF